MSLSKNARTAVAASLLAIGLAAALSGARASAAVFISAPPAVLAAGEGPLTWAFATDAPGTMWGAVTWKLDTEAEWHMCGGHEGSATMAAPPAGTYWVEIADDVDPAFAGEALHLAPFDRCSEPHAPALGPLHPVAISVVTVVPAAVVEPASTATVTAEVDPTGGACSPDPRERRRLRESVQVDRQRVQAGTSKSRRAFWRRRLAAHRAALRATSCPGG